MLSLSEAAVARICLVLGTLLNQSYTNRTAQTNRSPTDTVSFAAPWTSVVLLVDSLVAPSMAVSLIFCYIDAQRMCKSVHWMMLMRNAFSLYSQEAKGYLISLHTAMHMWRKGSCNQSRYADAKMQTSPFHVVSLLGPPHLGRLGTK